MSKTYILEPTQFVLTAVRTIYLVNVDTVITNGVYNADFTGSVIEIPELNILYKYAGFRENNGDHEFVFTPTGEADMTNIFIGDDTTYAVVSCYLGDGENAYAIAKNPNYSYELNQQIPVTVSVYKEDDPISKNFAFEDHPRNDLNGIAEIVAPFESAEPTPGGDIPETIAKLSKNVTYELHPHNDIDRIRFKGNLTNKENEEAS